MKNLVILGAGESGVGAALLALKKGYQVFISDAGRIKEKYKNEIKEYRIEYEERGHSLDKILQADLVVKSPGVPKSASIIQEIRDKKIPIVSEIEFASRYTKAKIVAITGSNGKTTTTSLVYHILSSAGLNVGLAGNIGDSFARKIQENNHDYFVLEVSSFQLDDIETFRPYIAVLLNITPDHLDQYGGKLELYARSKFRITYNQDEEDYFVYNLDDEYVVELLKDIKPDAQTVSFTTQENQKADAYYSDSSISINTPSVWSIPEANLSLSGKHNVSNSMAAALAANILEIDDTKIRECLSDFETVEHRLELVSKKGGVSFINDSKATNTNAVYYALQSMESPTIWIVGGVDKGNDYSELFDLVREKVKTIVCLGKDNQKVVDAFRDEKDVIIETGSMRDAVRNAFSVAEKGDTVLLSPACASFDLFDNYEHRGKLFKEEIERL